jgi:hypothetical protein
MFSLILTDVSLPNKFLVFMAHGQRCAGTQNDYTQKTAEVE